MRRIASVLALGMVLVVVPSIGRATGAGHCVFNAETHSLECKDSGSRPSGPGVGAPGPGNRVGPRYVYVTTRAPVGDCHYWSYRPGGLDAWDPANDAAVIAANSLPNCPLRVVVVEPPRDTAWDVFRSWTLRAPSVSLEPALHGITGLPTFLATPRPSNITHRETLPDSRILQVRARVSQLRVDWGDGTQVVYNPSRALSYPSGEVTHNYRTKTCSAEYRETNPSGGLCHPTLAYYTITTTYRWTGEFNVGAGWETLGTLDRTVTNTYDVDEIRGVPTPSP